MADEHVDDSPPEHRPFDIDSAINSLIARNNNDARAALRTLSEDNYQYRRNIRNLKKQIEELKKRPEMKTGQQVIDGERVKLLEDFEKLNVKVEDVRTGLAERDQFKTAEAERKKAESIAKGVKSLRLNPEVLADLIKTRNYQFQMQDVEIDGEEGEEPTTQPVLHLRKADTDPWVPADKFAERELKGYLPALRLSDEDNEESEADEAARSSRREPDEQPRRQPYPRQASGTGSKAPRNSADVANKHIQGRYVLPSKLRETQNN